MIIKFVLLIIYFVTHICLYINYCTRPLLENNKLLLREIKERKVLRFFKSISWGFTKVSEGLLTLIRWGGGQMARSKSK